MKIINPQKKLSSSAIDRISAWISTFIHRFAATPILKLIISRFIPVLFHVFVSQLEQLLFIK